MDATPTVEPDASFPSRTMGQSTPSVLWRIMVPPWNGVLPRQMRWGTWWMACGSTVMLVVVSRDCNAICCGLVIDVIHSDLCVSNIEDDIFTLL